ncbi:MAG: S8 family serine peptidase [Phycisphaerales bacterium]|nr:MAG: S8 family serine peptidase [Phycisphaerales bacterium]
MCAWVRLLTSVLAVVASLTSAIGAEETYHDIYYYRGDHRVDLSLALDELDVRVAPGAEADLAAWNVHNRPLDMPPGRLEATGQGTASFRCAAHAGIPSLMRTAARLRQSEWASRVHPVAYDSPEALVARDPLRRKVLTTEFVVRLHPGDDPESVVRLSGANLVRRLPIGSDLYLFAAEDELEAVRLANMLREVGAAVAAQPIIEEVMAKRFPNDPLYPDQWHLNNTGQGGGVPGIDINAESAWAVSDGSGTVIGIVDDGLEINHPDLAGNHDNSLGYDYNDNDPDPSPTCYQNHGTGVAGLAAARGYNGTGVVGAAPLATLAGIRLLGAAHTDVQEGLALQHRADAISIYNNSWGPYDNGTVKQGPGVSAAAAIETGINEGRGGKGCVYVWAAGNGGLSNDNVNYDGYANSRYSIAITSITDGDIKPNYTERGACIMASAPSAGGSSYLTTTDNSGSCGGTAGDYRDTFGGTSGAAPQGAGVVALVLAANPQLTWRDVQHVLVNSVAKNHAIDYGWAVNGAGHEYNHKYGFGRLDALAAVQLAQSWVNVPPEVSVEQTIAPSLAVPDDDPAGVTSQITIDADIKIETVEIPVLIWTPNRGDLRIELTSPDGTVSILAESNHDTNNNYNWTFTSIQHWDEHSPGVWTLRVIDEVPGNTASLSEWTLRLWGTPGCPAPAGDFDFDCDLDLADFATFAQCYYGSGVTVPPPGCTDQNHRIADLDTDGDVDLADFATFAVLFTG